MKEQGYLQQRKMARSGRADTAAVLTVRAVTSTKSVHPSSVVKPTRRQHKTPSGAEKGERQIATVKACTHTRGKKGGGWGGGDKN